MTDLRMNWLMTAVRMLLELTNELSFITQGEPTRDYYFEQIVYGFVSFVATGMCLPSRCPAMNYSASTHCHVNAYQFRSDQSVVSDTRPANRCPAVDVYSDFTTPAFSRHVTISKNTEIFTVNNIGTLGMMRIFACFLFSSLL
jgi:hypothetical protein